MRLSSCFALGLALVAASGNSFAATGKPDFGSYVGSDSLAPKPTLPASFITLPDVTGATHTTVTMNLPGDGDDASYAVDLTGASLYGSALSNCNVNDNGFITCNGSSTFFDNRALPDARFGGQVLIAPFWDDLAPVAGTSSIDIWTQAGSFVIVQWTSFSLVANPAARVTFRATFQLGAPNNRGAVVFQYLSMSGAGADGSSATIGIQNGDGFTRNQYAFDTTGAIVTGAGTAGSALQAVLFGYDTDGDRLSDTFETAVGSDPTKHDTDGGGLDDGAELALGHDPTVAGDDGPNTDTDGDGITDASEMFYGTNPAQADTDGDSSMTTSLKDADELFITRTDPTKADTDGDGFTDSAEIDASTNPLDPTSTPALPTVNLHTLNQDLAWPRAALDANGNIHVAAIAYHNDAVYYWLLDSTGKVLIPETRISLPKQITANRLQRTALSVAGGKAFITYEIEDQQNNGPLGFIRVNPAAAPLDGSPVPYQQIVEVNTIVTAPVGAIRHHEMVTDGTALHIAYINSPSFSVRPLRSVGYLMLGPDGSIERTQTLPLPPPKGPPSGAHRSSMPHIAVGSDGTVYIVTFGRTRPKWTGALLVAMINGSTVKTYSITSPSTSFERGAIAVRGSQLYLFGAATGQGRGTALRFAVVDLAGVTTSAPLAGDFWQQQANVDAASLLVPPTTLRMSTGNNNAVDASLLLLPNGGAVGYFDHKGVNDICMAPLSPGGAPTTAPFCIAAGKNDRGHRSRGAEAIDLLPLSDGTIGLVYGQLQDHLNNSGNPNNLVFSKLSQAAWNMPATFPPVIPAPRITSAAPAGSLHVGAAYTYAAMGTDATTPNALKWSLANAPASMTVSATGMVSWTPAAGDVGNHSATLTLCNTAPTPRCVSQTLALVVVDAAAPLFKSTPPTTAVVGTQWLYQLAATDPQGETITYALTAPSPAKGDMSLSASGLLSWTPSAADVGSVMVTVTATNTSGLSDTQTFTVVVTPALDVDPVFQTLPSTTAVVGQAYSYKAVAVDRGDSSATFTYSLSSSPSGNLAVAADGTLTWTPTSKEKGTVVVAILATSSSGRSATQSFAVTVIDNGKGGCAMAPGQAATGALAWLLVLAAAWLATRRRRA